MSTTSFRSWLAFIEDRKGFYRRKENEEKSEGQIENHWSKLEKVVMEKFK